MKIKALLLILITLNVSVMAQQSTSQKTTDHKVEVKQIDPFNYVYYEFKGPYMQSFNDFPKLMEFLQKSNAKMGPWSLGVFYDDPAEVPENELNSEAGMMVIGDVKPSGMFKFKQIDGFKAATIKYTDMNMIQGSYDKIFEYVFSNKLTPAGPAYEFYYSYDESNIDAEIVLPIE